ncbi:Transposable element P transposase, partial [Eumeta japonica]
DHSEWLGSSLDVRTLGTLEEDNPQDLGAFGVDDVNDLIEFCPELDEDVEDLIEYCPESFEETEFGDFDEAYLNDAGTLADDALEYLVGYTIHRLKLQEYESHSNSSSWVDQVATCSLKKPKESFLIEFRKLEGVFGALNGDHISLRQNIRQKLLERSKAVNLDENIKNFFFKCRLYFRVRYLNQHLKDDQTTKTMMTKKSLGRQRKIEIFIFSFSTREDIDDRQQHGLRPQVNTREDIDDRQQHGSDSQ